MKVVAIIQARMRSTRLPGKVLKELCGRTVLAHDIQRVQAARLVDQVVVATSDLAADDPVAREAEKAGAAVFRGSEADVLSRYHGAAEEFQAGVIVRVTSDCPLFDPELLDAMLAVFLAALETETPYDYFSNTLNQRTYPVGLDAEIFTRQALETAHRDGRQPFEREHVTPYLYQNPQRFRLGGMHGEKDHSGYRWTLDTPEDLQLITRVYDALYREEDLFTTAEVLQLMRDRPELPPINIQVVAKPLAMENLGNLVIRADASAHIGSGHVMRCLALAQAWPAEAGKVILALPESGAFLQDRLKKEGFTVETVRAGTATRGDAEATVDLARRFEAGWLVVDGYPFDNAFLEKVIAGPARVLLLDDTGRQNPAPVDILLNQNVHASPELYPGADTTTRLLLGAKHAMLRREFLQADLQTPLPLQARRVLVTLGGGDPANHTGKVLAALAHADNRELSARVLVGAANPHREVLEKQAAALPQEVEILTAVSDMPAQYRWADLAVTAGGGTLWELAHLGVPALTMIVADNQEPASRLMDSLGAVHCLGWAERLQVEGLAAALASLARDADRRSAMSEAGRCLIDGRGAERVVGAMGLLATRSEGVSS